MLSSILGFDDFLDSPTAPLEYGATTRAAKRPAGTPFDAAAAAWVRHAAYGAADGAAASARIGFSLSSTRCHSPELLR